MIDVTVIGAGKTGRGFIARLLQDPNVRHIDFIDKNPDLVRRLNDEKSFRIVYFGGKAPETKIANYTAYTWEDAPSINPIVFVSVGGRNLPDVGKELSHRLTGPTRIVCAENAANPDKTLGDAIGNPDAKVAKSTVFCTTTDAGDGSLLIHSETYPYLQYDADALGGEIEGLSNFRGIHGFGNFLTRKLFTYNAASAIIAYIGAFKGYKVYGDAANDPEILSLLDENYAATNEAMCKTFGYEKKDQEEFAALSKKKFTDRSIEDTVARNARDPLRKIGPAERVSGPLKMLYEGGYDATVLEKTLAALLLYDGEGEDAWEAEKAKKGYEGLLRENAGIDPESPLGQAVLDYVRHPEKIAKR